jgi:hypothetical protein
MTHATTNTAKTPDREHLRRELLKLIVRHEATRRDPSKAQSK